MRVKLNSLLTVGLIICFSSFVFAEVRVNPVTIYNQGVQAFNKKDYAMAQKLFDDAIKNKLQEPYLSDASHKLDELYCYSSNGPATKVWLSHLSALHKADYRTAYNLMSKGFREKMSLDKYQAALSPIRDKFVAELSTVAPGREKKGDGSTLYLNFCRDGQPTKSFKFLLEDGSYRLEDI